MAEMLLDTQVGQNSTDEYQQRARELRERASRSADPDYKILLIEAAHFDPVNIRRTVREAAHFYECVAAGLVLPLVE